MSVWKRLRHCARDDRGAEVLEYAVLAGLLLLACIAALTALGIHVEDKWHRLLRLFR